MTEFEIILYSFLMAVFILFIYGFFFWYLRRKKEKHEKVDWEKRISLVKQKREESKSADPPLIKEQESGQTYLKSKLPRVEGLQQWIQHAGLNLLPIVLIAESALLGIGIGLVFIFALKASIIFSVLLGVASSFLIPWGIITVLTIRRTNKFLEELPVALDMMRRALRAGHSADGAIEMVAENAEGLVGDTFRTITSKIRIGESPEEVFSDIANRLGIDDFRMLAIVFILQRETGGSLAEAVENFSKIIRARHNLRKKVKALSAEVRVTAMILTGLPFFILGAVYLTSPRYLDPLFYTDNGQLLLILGGVMLFLGILVIGKMAYKDVY